MLKVKTDHSFDHENVVRAIEIRTTRQTGQQQKSLMLSPEDISFYTDINANNTYAYTHSLILDGGR